MSAEVVAVQAAAAVASDKRGRTAIGAIIVGILMIFILPIIVITSIFSSAKDIKIDTDEAVQVIEANMSTETKGKLQHVDDVCNAISTEFAGRNLDALTIKKAQAVYVCVFYDIEKSDENFVTKFADCYEGSPDDDTLLYSLEGVFGVSINKKDFQNLMSVIKSNAIDIKDIPDEKNNLGLVQWAEFAYENGWGYVYGSHGQVLTESELKSLESVFGGMVSDKEDYIRSHWMGKRVSDCCGLIKGYGWYNASTGKIEYGSNGMQDVTANGMYQAATEKGPMSTMPEIPGLAVWQDGHIGVYIGNGWVASAKTTTPKKTVAEIAKEVINGKWGNGAERKKELEAAGYDYNAVQKEVNKQLK